VKRDIDIFLQNWKNEENRKVLLLRGARQVGKTYSVREFGKKFNYFLEVNFESNRSIHSIFEGDKDPQEICNKLSTFFNIPINDGETLLFFDEIQACLPAISSLRFFYENRPDLHLIAAGSLLEFALSELPSFGVGRIESVFLYPLSFDEFLQATNEDKLLELKQMSNPLKSLEKIFHDKLIQYLRKFMLTGGLPEVVDTFIRTGDLFKSQTVLDNLITGLNDDFAKYKNKVPVTRIRDLFNAVVFQSGGNFMYSRVDGNYNYSQLREARDLLEMAGLIYIVVHSSANGLPLGSETNPKKFKIILYDHGISQRILGLDFSKQLLLGNFDFVNKGNIAEQFVGNELIKYSGKNLRPYLYFWQREKRGSMAEVDYIIQKEENIVPLEVKSGTTGKMQSLRLLMVEKKMKTGVRVSLENFCKYENIDVYPLYAISNMIR
jgi:predicted AAA+ superfamily ATPase